MVPCTFLVSVSVACRFGDASSIKPTAYTLVSVTYSSLNPKPYALSPKPLTLNPKP